MRILLILVGAVVAALAIAAGVVLWLLADAESFKPEIEAMIAENTGMQVQLDGELSWGLWPPITLRASDVTFADEATDYHLGILAIDVAAMQLLNGGTIQVDSAKLSNLKMTERSTGAVTLVNSLQLDDFAPGKPAPFSADITMVNDPEPNSELTVDAMLRLDIDADTLTLSDMNFDYDGTQGTCQVDVSHLSRDPVRASPSSPDDILPLSTFRAMDWVADCLIPEYATEDLNVANIAVKSSNTAARSSSEVVIPEIFGGALTLNANIDTRPAEPVWTITPDAKNLQSQQIMDVLSPQLAWVAPLLAGGEFTLRGNTAEDLARSVKGEMNISASQGTLDISLVRNSLLQIAQLFGESAGVEDWPEILNYDSLKGDWQVDGTGHDLDFAFDNLALAADGEYDPISDSLDMLASLTINEHSSSNTLKVNPALYGVPIPVRCKGTMAVPSCGFDAEAGKQTLAKLAANRARQEAGDKLDEVIGEKVPEEYRDAAKGLLKGLLGGDKD